MPEPDFRKPPHHECGRVDGDGIYISKYPDVCLTPAGSSKVPIPYSIVAKETDAAGEATTVKATGSKTHNMGSIVTNCTGDEPGTGGGVKSGTTASVCRHKEHSSTVKIEGKPAVHDKKEVYMNNDNTTGTINRPSGTETYKRTPPFHAFVGEPGQKVPKPGSSPTRPKPTPPTTPAPPTPSDPVPSDPKDKYWTITKFAVRRIAVVATAILEPSPLAGPEVAEGPDWFPRHKETDSTTIKRKRRKREECKVGPHKEIQPKCDGQAHHIVPDFVYRYGRATADRVPNAPSFRDGMTVCMDIASHKKVHDHLRPELRARGQGSHRNRGYNHTSPMHDVLNSSNRALDYSDLSEECKAAAREAASNQVQDNLKKWQPVRTLEKPLPSGDALKVLQRGKY